MTKFEASLIKQLRSRVTDLEIALMEPVEMGEIIQLTISCNILNANIVDSVRDRMEAQNAKGQEGPIAANA